MKPKNFAAIMLAATTLTVSCNWFSRSKKDDPSKALVGKWGFVTVPDKIDSSKKISSADSLLQTSMLTKDSSNAGIEFKSDSSYSIYSDGSVQDSGKYYIDRDSLTLYLKEDSTYEPLKIKKLTDSTIEFYFLMDSFPTQLHKKKQNKRN